ncbi:hypothetical protein [Hydrogenimonas sp.]
MALFKKEVLVRPNSTADFETAMNWTRDWLQNTFQDDPENKDENGNYIDYFFADVYFAPGHATNSGQLWRIFSDPCGQKYDMQPSQTGRIEYIVSDKESVDNAVASLDNDVEDIDNTINAMSAELNDHESRIATLEASDGVEAEVI